MTDLPPSSPDDEIVSAVLDGVATDAERARVEDDVALRARLEELRQVRDQVAAPVAPLDDVTARRILSGALDAADQSADADAATPASLAATTRSRRRAPRRDATVVKWVSAAAAVALIALLAVPLLASLDTGDEADQAATGVAESTDDSSAGEADAAGEESSGGAGADVGELEAERHEQGGAYSSSARGDGAADSADPMVRSRIGEFDSVEGFAAAASQTPGTTPDESAAAPVDEVVPGCDLEPAGDALQTIAVGAVDGRDVVAEVWRSGDDRIVRVIERSSCEVLLVRGAG